MTALPEMIGYLAAFLTTASFLPQALLALRTRDTRSLSLAMYSAFTLGVLLWLIYGLFLRDPAIIAANAVTFILSASILAVKIHNTLQGLDIPRLPAESDGA